MKIPTHIKIKDEVVYEIVYVDSFPKGKSKKKTYAECNFTDKQIKLSLDQTDKEMDMSLIHEVFHCWEYEYKIKIPHGIIHKLEIAVYNTLTLNKWIEK